MATTFCLAVRITETSLKPHYNIGMFPAWRAGYPNSAGLRLFIEGAQMALARADLCPRGFDGNNAEELAAARAQWKKLKSLSFALTYWQQGANGRWEMKSSVNA